VPIFGPRGGYLTSLGAFVFSFNKANPERHGQKAIAFTYTETFFTTEQVSIG
jgi:hypothetical protein